MATVTFDHFGVSTKDLERRRTTESSRMDSVQASINIVLEQLKESGDWVSISAGQLVKDNIIKSASERGPVLQGLQAHENIIVRPAENSRTADGTISPTVLFQYKYVTKEEKKALSYDGICYRKVQGELKELIVNALNKYNDVKSLPADIFAVVEYMVSQGAYDHWVQMPLLQIANLSYVWVNNVVKVFNDLSNAKVLCIGRTLIADSRQGALICHFAHNEEEYVALENQVNSENIEPYIIPKKKRNRGKATQQSMAEVTAKTEEIYNFVDDLLSDEFEEDIPIPERFKSTGSISSNATEFEHVFTELLNTGKAQLQVSIDAYVKNQLEVELSQLSKTRDMLSKASTENRELREELAEYKEQIAKYKATEKGLVEYNNLFVENSQQALTMFVGQFLSIIEDFTKVKHYELNRPEVINSYKKRAFDLIGEVSKNIVEFKPDKYPPALKN